MKLQILNEAGTKIKEMTTKLFEEPIRIDLIRKVVESERVWQPYSPTLYAGMNRSASGQVRHKRHSWKSDRGRGMSRIPKKQMWRRGTQFSWVGAIIPFARGGRRAHPPHGQLNNKKINKKEYRKAFLSTLSYISSPPEINKKYHSLARTKISLSLPLIVDSSVITLQTKKFLQSLQTVAHDAAPVVAQTKNVRAGRGKARGRKYKKSSGLLLVLGKDETKKVRGVDMVSAQNLRVSDLAENGARLTAFSERAVHELEEKYFPTEKRKEMRNEKPTEELKNTLKEKK